jgi:bHLH factor
MAAAAAAAITVQSHSQSLHLNPTPTTPNNNSNKLMLAKPAVGTVEWQRLRRDNHKEVERRRREAINSGVAELSKIVPGCEKAKGSILQRTIQYIHEMREADQSNVEKWTLEKILMDQAIQELTRELEVTRDELQRVKGEREVWRERAEAATAAISGEPLDKKRRK